MPERDAEWPAGARMAADGQGKLKKGVLVSLGAVLAIATGVLAVSYFGRGSNDAEVDRAYDQVKQLPLVGLVLSEHPDLDAKVRQAIKDELADPTKSGPNRVFLFGAQVRKQYIVPALRNSDDATALKAAEVLAELVKHLRVTDPNTCREFGQTGLEHPDRLDSEGSAIFERALAAQEDAYLSGKAAPDRPSPGNNEITKLLSDAGYTEADFQKLASYATLSPSEACAAMDKLYSAPAMLQTQKGAVVARYLLTISQ